MDLFVAVISEISDFYHSPLFSVIKFLLGIYAVVLFVDIVLLLFQRGLSGNLRETLLGMNVPPELVTKRNKLLVKWNKIKERLASKKEPNWKAAIIEADHLIDDLIERMEYPGANLDERLLGINPGQISTIEKIREAHEVKKNIIAEPNFQLSRELAEETIGKYEEFLKEFEVL